MINITFNYIFGLTFQSLLMYLGGLLYLIWAILLKIYQFLLNVSSSQQNKKLNHILKTAIIFHIKQMPFLLSQRMLFCAQQMLWVYHCVKSVRIQSYFGPYFPAFGLNNDRYSLSLPIQSKCGKIRTRITPNTAIFYEVYVLIFIMNVGWQQC